ncbi:hypothetical protein CROQUDRAFT_97758 [Cronartium quercuum f. sp. fusiforme G11]|uniref:Uncharacterized protein n=1 Tax=Cronartium quercuum f. sp. fusiforme G11 TaxID=708437 RepID=A0A9P6NDL1_9BASI|nr:hypothetical protein CROQUDRAFT_97758 [Cronartium quercuum f. sp. fusiforme G11]
MLMLISDSWRRSARFQTGCGLGARRFQDRCHPEATTACSDVIRLLTALNSSQGSLVCHGTTQITSLCHFFRMTKTSTSSPSSIHQVELNPPSGYIVRTDGRDNVRFKMGCTRLYAWLNSGLRSITFAKPMPSLGERRLGWERWITGYSGFWWDCPLFFSTWINTFPSLDRALLTSARTHTPHIPLGPFRN